MFLKPIHPACRHGADQPRKEIDMMDNKDVASVLNDLLENARDGEYGFRTCAEEVEA